MNMRRLQRTLGLLVIIIACVYILIYAPSISDVFRTGLLVEGNQQDLGHIDRGMVIKHRFCLWNVSMSKMSIDTVMPSCTCTTVDVNRYEVPPFGKSVIFAKIDTGQQEAGRNVSGERIIFRTRGWHEEDCFVSYVISPNKTMRPRLH